MAHKTLREDIHEVWMVSTCQFAAGSSQLVQVLPNDPFPLQPCTMKSNRELD